MSILRYLRSNRSDGPVHAWLAIAWLVLAIPAVLWWRESVAFVFASVYANVAGHWSAYQAAKGETGSGLGFSPRRLPVHPVGR
jgi:hypothetical protein